MSPLKDETRPVIFVPGPENPTVEDTSPVKAAVVPCKVPAIVLIYMQVVILVTR